MADETEGTCIDGAKFIAGSYALPDFMLIRDEILSFEDPSIRKQFVFTRFACGLMQNQDGQGSPEHTLHINIVCYDFESCSDKIRDEQAIDIDSEKFTFAELAPKAAWDLLRKINTGSYKIQQSKPEHLYVSSNNVMASEVTVDGHKYEFTLTVNFTDAEAFDTVKRAPFDMNELKGTAKVGRIPTVGAGKNPDE